MCARTLLIGAIIISAILLTTIAEASLNIIERDDWGAKPPSLSLTTFLPSVPFYVLIRDTDAETCFYPEECKAAVRMVQIADMKRGCRDINDNFLVGGDGGIYVGRGWDYVTADPDNRNTSSSVVIRFIGNFNIQEPTNVQLRATQLLLESGMDLKRLQLNYKLLGYNQMTDAAGHNPGVNLYEIIRAWPHWSPMP